MDEAGGSRADSAGANTLTDNNTVPSQTGIISLASQYVAVNLEYLSLASLNWATSVGASFTIAAWLAINTNTGSNHYVLSWNANNAGNVNLLWNSANAGMSFYTDVGHIISMASSTFPVDGVFRFVTAWRDNTDDSIHLTLNNTGEVSTTGTTDPASTSTAMNLGRFSGSGVHLDGAIDEIGIWNRVLTTLEKTELYNSGAGNTYPF
jgi:hypothetical protein